MRLGLLTLVWFGIVACGAPSAPKTPAPQHLAIDVSTANVFAKQDFQASPSVSTTFSTHATSLSKTPLDADVVERVIRARLKAVSREALDDLFEKAGAHATSKPARDLIDTIASLIAEASDGDARSQTLVAALVRDGLAAWIADIGPGLGGGTECAKVPEQFLDAAYEGLASSQYLRVLGFPESDGTFANAACATFGGQVAMLVDTLARFPDLTKGSADALATAASAIDVADMTSCGALLPLLPVELESALKDATVDDVASLRDLYDAAKIIKSPSSSLASGPKKDEYRKCVGVLATFTDAFDNTLLRFAADIGTTITLGDVTTMLASVETTVSAIRAKDGTQIAAVQSILTRLVDGRALRRGDVILLVQFVGEQLKPRLAAIEPAAAGTILVAVVEALPTSIREDSTVPAGIRMDVPALASTVLATFSQQTRDGVYLRATVGTGYLFSAGEESALSTSVHEELGIGYRWQHGAILHGPHVIASGILYSMIEDAETSDRLFIGGGYSVNLYRLIDVSASVGALVDLDGGDHDLAAIVGLQIPIFDYLSALTEGGDVGQGTTVGGK